MGGRLRADHNPRRQCAVPELDPENRWHFEPPVASTQAGVGSVSVALHRGALRGMRRDFSSWAVLRLRAGAAVHKLVHF